MDNSLTLYKQKLDAMINELERFADLLNHHVIIQPRETIENAVRHGFPEDIALTYLRNYYVYNESDAQNIIRYINNKSIPYLQNVAFYIESAINIGGENVRDKTTGYQDLDTKHVSHSKKRPDDDLAYRTYQLIKKDEAFRKNNLNLEKSLGIKQGPPMSIAEADKQNANPNFRFEYIEDQNGDFYIYNNEIYTINSLPKEARNNIAHLRRCKKNPDYQEKYAINCATCAAAYVLRLRGFDVKAKGNPETKGNRNTWLSECHSFDIWENEDGSTATPMLYKEWMKEKGLEEMSPADFRDFFEESCKDVGVYVVTVAWKEKGAHATILQRDRDGKLYYIEPQVYESAHTQDGRRNIDDLIENMAPIQPEEKGVMRVDNKLFKTEYVDLFEITTNIKRKI